MTKTLATEDIRMFLKGLYIAIVSDQAHVDALPPERFSPMYSDGMWRNWRRDHLTFIEELLLTADAIPPTMLRDLTGVAITHKPDRIGSLLLELFAEVASGSGSPEDYGTSDRFFGLLIAQISAQPKGRRRDKSARISVLQWLPFYDPLRIAQDPECGYRNP